MAPTYQPDWNTYDQLTTAPRRSMLWASEGEAGSGKTHFSLTAPGPIWVAAFDPHGTKRIDPAIIGDKDIRVARYPFEKARYTTKADLQKAATILWNRFTADYDYVLGAGVRTILWDREDMIYKIQRYSTWGESSAAPKEYEDLYAEYVAMLQKAGSCGVNLGLLRGYKNKWVSKFDAGKGKMVGHDTGERIAEGMNKIPDHVDIMLTHRWDDVSSTYMVKIGKFTNADFRGHEFPNANFADIASLAYPETTLADWE
jgi:hypothetical protein